VLFSGLLYGGCPTPASTRQWRRTPWRCRRAHRGCSAAMHGSFTPQPTYLRRPLKSTASPQIDACAVVTFTRHSQPTWLPSSESCAALTSQRSATATETFAHAMWASPARLKPRTSPRLCSRPVARCPPPPSFCPPASASSSGKGRAPVKCSQRARTSQQVPLCSPSNSLYSIPGGIRTPVRESRQVSANGPQRDRLYVPPPPQCPCQQEVSLPTTFTPRHDARL
jgi:hypothetical protein